MERFIISGPRTTFVAAASTMLKMRAGVPVIRQACCTVLGNFVQPTLVGYSQLRILAALCLPVLLSSQAYAGPDIKDCEMQETKEISQAIDWGAAHWKEFEAFLEMKTDINVKNCLEERFKKNGKVVCETKSTGECKTAAGWASPFNKKCHMCPAFLKTVDNLSKPVDRKACYFTMVTHEWSHTCERTHKSIDTMDNLAFDFWKKLNADTSIDSMTSCDMAENQK